MVRFEIFDVEKHVSGVTHERHMKRKIIHLAEKNSPISFAVGVLAVFKGSAPAPQGFAKKKASIFVENNRLFGFERRISQEKRGSKKMPAFLSRKIGLLLWKRVFLEK